MKKLIRHKWIKQDGFKISKCKHCGCIRKWCQFRYAYTYTTGTLFSLVTPECKRLMHCDKIEL